MKKFIPALLLTTSIPLLAMAAPPAPPAQPAPPHAVPGDVPPPPHKAGPHAAGFKNLTPEQHAKMREIMQTQDKKRKEITRKYLDRLPEAEKKAMHDELNQSREDASKAIRAILTPEQQKAFDEQKTKRDAHMKEWKEFQEWKANQAKK